LSLADSSILGFGISVVHVRDEDRNTEPGTSGARGIHINASTAATRRTGERMDHSLAMDVLLQRARGVSAETSRMSMKG
jgi:hypothetical protein